MARGMLGKRLRVPSAERFARRFITRPAIPSNSRKPARPPRWEATATSYDNALAESVIGLYKAELVERKGPPSR